MSSGGSACVAGQLITLVGGTEGSNPAPSSVESVANLTFYASASTNDYGSWRLFLIDSIIAMVPTG
jgi:hypothetical protein